MTNNEIYEGILNMLREEKPVTRMQICMRLGITHNSTNDRTVRKVIADIATKYPVISVSAERGYTLAKDAASIQHQINENEKRARMIKKRNEPLYKALVKYPFTERIWGDEANV